MIEDSWSCTVKGIAVLRLRKELKSPRRIEIFKRNIIGISIRRAKRVECYR
jgi:hypothetical protein